MFLRIVWITLLVALFAASMVVFEAASATSLALDAVVRAQTNDSPVVRARLLDRAEETLLRSWARPIAWHAGATEALSAIYLLKAEADGDPALMQLSADWAARTVQLAPVQPHAWTRLAALAERGYANRVCDVDACLEQSWRMGPMIDPATDCARLQIGHRRGLLTPKDPRIVAYVRSGVSRRDAARCLSFLTPNEIFETLLITARPSN